MPALRGFICFLMQRHAFTAGVPNARRRCVRWGGEPGLLAVASDDVITRPRRPGSPACAAFAHAGVAGPGDLLSVLAAVETDTTDPRFPENGALLRVNRDLR